MIVLGNRNGTASFLHSKEVVMQVNPLAMIAYEIGILPLIKNLKRWIPHVTQPWYADNVGALGAFARIETYFDMLNHQGSGRRYYPKPSKIVLIVLLENLESGKYFGARHGFKVRTAHVILGVTSVTTSPKTIVLERVP